VEASCAAAVVALIGMRADPARYDLQYAVTPSGSRINESNYAVDGGGAFYKQYNANAGPKLGAWSHVVLHAHYAPPATVSVTIDGVAVLPPTAITPPVTSGSPGILV